jgi:hypothetical protein
VHEYLCPNGHPVRPSARFCPGCGAAIAHPVDETTMRERQWLPVAVLPAQAPATVDGHRPWARAALVVVALLVLGTAGGWAGVTMSRRAGAPGAAPTTGPSTVGPSATESPAQRPIPSVPAPQSGVGLVDIASVTSDTRAPGVAWTLNEYFSGINERDAARALAVMDPAGVVDRDDPRQAGRFRADVSTTTDSNVAVRWIRDDHPAVYVLAGVTFTSRQEAAYGPNGQTCTNWSLVYTLSVSPAGTYAIVRSAGTNAPC